MLILKDCDIQPGDILFVVSNPSKRSTGFKGWVTSQVLTLKKLAQSLSIIGGKHGHREVVSVFVCTGRNQYGVICHNYQRQIGLSSSTFIQKLRGRSMEELSAILIEFSSKKLNKSQIQVALSTGEPWIKALGLKLAGVEDTDAIIRLFVEETQGDKEKIIALIVKFWHISGQADILPTSNSSLLVFKPTDPSIREKFLEASLAQIEVTKRLSSENQSRTSVWKLIASFFKSSRQDEIDKSKQTPSETTYCARNVIQMLNQVDPGLVNRGRHVFPKSLEAGMREASKKRQIPPALEVKDDPDDFEALIAEREQSLPPFTLNILPASGKELLAQLLAVLDGEIERIEHKRFFWMADKQKADEMKKIMAPFRDLKFQRYPIHLQLAYSLELIAKLQGPLQKKTGLFGVFRSRSYSHVRAFARTQGIFDGDVRDAIERLKSEGSILKQGLARSSDSIARDSPQVDVSLGHKTYIFSDWSFQAWSEDKKMRMLDYMSKLLAEGNALYFWEKDHLVKMDVELLQTAINGEDFDDLLSDKLTPVSRAALVAQAARAQIDSSHIEFLDYRACKALTDDTDPIEGCIEKVAPLFSDRLDDSYLTKTKLAILDIEIANAAEDPTTQQALQQLRSHFFIETPLAKSYQSGVDSKPIMPQSHVRAPIFHALDIGTTQPSSQYYRGSVYSDLKMVEHPRSPFEYFDLKGMEPIEGLRECSYIFHPDGLGDDQIKKRRGDSHGTLFLGEKTLSLHHDWQPLPSLHPNETLMDIAIQGLRPEDVEIKYAEKTHLYYIRLAHHVEPQTATVCFLLKMPKEYTSHPVFNTILSVPAHHQDIRRLMMKYLQFKKDSGALSHAVGAKVGDGATYLEEARKLSMGSCRLRCIAFKEEMQRLYPDIPVSIVVNSDHCFIEMELDGQWRRYCLGGYTSSPGLFSTVKSDRLDTCGYESRRHRFFSTLPSEEGKPGPSAKASIK